MQLRLFFAENQGFCVFSQALRYDKLIFKVFDDFVSEMRTSSTETEKLAEEHIKTAYRRFVKVLENDKTI